MTCEINKEDSIGDHFLIEIKCNVALKSTEVKEKVEISSWKSYTKDKMISEVGKINYDEMNGKSVDEKSKVIFNQLSTILNKLVKRKIVHKSQNPWYNKDLKLLKILKDRQYKKHEHTKDPADKEKWIVLCSQYKEKIKKAKCQFIQNKIRENQHNPRKMWKTLKSLYKSESQSISKLIVDGEDINDKSEIAYEMNKFIINSIDKIVKEIPKPSKCTFNDNVSPCANKFSIKPIDMKELKLIVKNMRGKFHIDNINGAVISDALSDEKFANFLLNFVNESMESGIMPENMKTSIVNPIP